MLGQPRTLQGRKCLHLTCQLPIAQRPQPTPPPCPKPSLGAREETKAALSSGLCLGFRDGGNRGRPQDEGLVVREQKTALRWPVGTTPCKTVSGHYGLHTAAYPLKGKVFLVTAQPRRFCSKLPFLEIRRGKEETHAPSTPMVMHRRTPRRP